MQVIRTGQTSDLWQQQIRAAARPCPCEQKRRACVRERIRAPNESAWVGEYVHRMRVRELANTCTEWECVSWRMSWANERMRHWSSASANKNTAAGYPASKESIHAAILTWPLCAVRTRRVRRRRRTTSDGRRWMIRDIAKIERGRAVFRWQRLVVFALWGRHSFARARPSQAGRPGASEASRPHDSLPEPSIPGRVSLICRRGGEGWGSRRSSTSAGGCPFFDAFAGR